MVYEGQPSAIFFVIFKNITLILKHSGLVLRVFLFSIMNFRLFIWTGARLAEDCDFVNLHQKASKFCHKT